MDDRRAVIAGSDRPTGELVAEFFGTFVIIAFGCGVVAMTVAALPESGRGDIGLASAGDWLLIAWGWGFAVAFAVYVAGGVSGAHLNPAVTLAQAVVARLSVEEGAQLLGRPAAGRVRGRGAGVLQLPRRHLGVRGARRRSPAARRTRCRRFGIFGTFPAPYFDSWFGPFMDQVIGTAFLVGFIFAVTDEFNAPGQGPTWRR